MTKIKNLVGIAKNVTRKFGTVITSTWRHTAWIGNVSLSTTE
jgi:hypothetical protein